MKIALCNRRMMSLTQMNKRKHCLKGQSFFKIHYLPHVHKTHQLSIDFSYAPSHKTVYVNVNDLHIPIKCKEIVQPIIHFLSCCFKPQSTKSEDICFVLSLKQNQNSRKNYREISKNTLQVEKIHKKTLQN